MEVIKDEKTDQCDAGSHFNQRGSTDVCQKYPDQAKRILKFFFDPFFLAFVTVDETEKNYFFVDRKKKV